MHVTLSNFRALMIIFLCSLSKYVQSDVIDLDHTNLHRLPKNVSPGSYELWLYPHLKSNNFTYEGRVIINISVLSRTNAIILNSAGLNIIQENSHLLHGNTSIEILFQELDKERQFHIILLAVTIVPGDYSLRLDFTGEIRDNLFGFYRSAIKVRNETRWMAVTQFSPTFARTAFPCFDEPYLKASFKLHIGHYRDEEVTSNMLPESIEPTEIENYVLTTMQTTPRMSTYLVGWSIHNFKYDNLSNFTSFGVWTRDSMFGKGHRALEQGQQIYSTLQTWMDIENPIRKMEHIAIPDFYFSAMENWGMITFRESALLQEDNVTSTVAINNGMNTMGHEYGHTWFGNLVTPEFWTVAWLKEGFSTYVSYIARSLIDRDLRAMDLFVVETLESVLLLDSVKHLRTMNGKEVGERDTSATVMDFVTYHKASSVIRMFATLMGDNHFQMAIRSYLKDRLYDFGTPSILYKHLRNYSEGLVIQIDLEEVIESYANQPGYPLITLTRDYSSDSLKISQQRFYQNPHYAYPNNSTWWVPLSLVSQKTSHSNMSLFGAIWLRKNETEITMKIRDIDTEEWIICDSNKAGYYRVNYDERNWDMLTDHLLSGGSSMISPVARATLLDDAFNLARGGYINYNVPLDLSRYLISETEYEPWLAAINAFAFLNKMFQDLSVLRESLQDYAIRLLAPIYQSLTLTASNGNSLREKLFRHLIQSTACTMGNEHCLNTANSIFRRWIGNSSERIDPDMKSFVYCVGIRDGSTDDWEKVLARFLKEDLHTEQELLISGLGCTRNSTLITRYLDLMMVDGPQLPKQYRLKILDAVLAENPENMHPTLFYLSRNLRKILNTRRFSFFNNIISSIAKQITSSTNLRKLLSIVDKNASLLKPVEGTLKKATADIQANISWIKKYSPIIEKLIVSMMYH